MRTRNGFTLIEILVVAPMVILSIGAFIALIVTLTGNTLASRAASILQNDTQIAASQIEDDIRRSVAFLAVNDITLSSGNPQGYLASPDTASSTGSVVNFTNVNKTASGGSTAALILKQVATSKNPLAKDAVIVHQVNSPASCENNYSQNTPVYVNVVYFIAGNSLWRRTISPTDHATPLSLCGASHIYQIPSCSPGTTHSYCRTKDSKLIEGITTSQFTFNYFTSLGSTTPVAAATNAGATDAARNSTLTGTPAVEITLEPSKSASGRDITAKATTKAVRLNAL